MSGAEVKALIISKGLKVWQVAYEMGISEVTLSRWFRKPFDKETVNRVKTAIAKLTKHNDEK